MLMLIAAIDVGVVAALRAQTNETAGMLRFFAGELQRNVESLRSLTGKAIIIEAAEVQGADVFKSDKRPPIDRSQRFVMERPASADFALDLVSDRLYSRYRYTGATKFTSVDGAHSYEFPLEKKHSHDQESILTASAFITVLQTVRYSKLSGFPNLPEPRGGYRLVSSQAPEVGRRLTHHSTVFDPRRLFEVGGRRADELLGILATFSEKGTVNVALTEEGREGQEWFSLEYTLRNGDRMVHRLQRSGHTVLLIEDRAVTQGHGTFSSSWEYTDYEGVSVPTRYEYVHRNQDGSLDNSRSIRLTDVTVNRPIPANTFALGKIEVNDLDRYLDEIEDRVFIFVNGELVAAEDFSSTTVRRSRGSGLWLVAVVLLMGILLGTTWWRLQKWMAR